MSCAARAAAPTRSPTTPAATGIARSARARAAQRWLEARQADLLPVEYYHVVFTLPAPIADIAYQNKAVIYGLLFDVAAETLLTIAADPKHLGAQHRRDAGAAHLGLGADASPARARHRSRRRAVAGRRALGRLQAGLLPAGARAVAAVPAALPRRARSRRIARGRLQFFGEHAALADAQRLRAAGSRRCASASGWSMPSARSPGPQAVLAYLSRYTHRVAISNSRLARHGRARRDLPLEGLPRQGQDAPQDDDARRRRVHAPLPAARPARRLPSHPPLRAARQRRPQGQPGAARELLHACPQPHASPGSAEAEIEPRRAVLRLPALRRPMLVLQTFARGQTIRAPPAAARAMNITRAPSSASFAGNIR